MLEVVEMIQIVLEVLEVLKVADLMFEQRVRAARC